MRGGEGCIRGHCFRASHSECQRERDRRVEEHPVTYQSLFRFYLFYCFFLHLFTQIVFPSTSLLFKLCVAQCESILLLWKLERGDNEASKLHVSLFVFRLSKLSLSVFIYCTITVQFMLALVQWNVWLLNAFFFKCFCASATIFLRWKLFVVSLQNRWWKSVVAALTLGDSRLGNTSTITFLPNWVRKSRIHL